jgi:8-amino-7-oxononanoate synthase
VAVLDFTSALYLGISHASHDLRPFGALTTGAPAALREPPEATWIAASLASLVGLERATLARSTLHAFWDLFTVYGREPTRILADAGSYPIARWGAERAILKGAELVTFRHHDVAALGQMLRRPRTPHERDWIVVDGFCTGCGRLAPLAEYLALAREVGARLVVDDTQALGILGEGRSSDAPFGYGGGGSLRATGSAGPEVLLVASLAKGFGAPLTMIGGNRAAIAHFEAMSQTRVHSSPPTLADLHAAERALAVNRESGDQRRFRLVALVTRLRRGLRRLGLNLGPTSFPLQSIRATSGIRLPHLNRGLGTLGVNCVLRRPGCANAIDLAFLITAAHLSRQIDDALLAVASALPGAAVSSPMQSHHKYITEIS